jgi:ribosome recycling factor
MSEVSENAKERMQKSVDSLKLDLSKIRTGRAHAGILDHLSVDYYGSQTLLTQLANITVADATTINIQPYEKTMIQTIEKAIRESDMGLNPATSGELISEDDERGMQEVVQKITDDFIVEVDRLIDAKEKDLLVI